MLVLDSSVLIAFLVQERDTTFARPTLVGSLGRPRLAPALLSFEVVNVLNAKRRRKLIDETEQAQLLRIYLDQEIVLEPAPSATVAQAISALAVRYGLTGYDGAYLETALRTGTELATLDAELAQAARAAGVVVLAP